MSHGCQASAEGPWRKKLVEFCMAKKLQLSKCRVPKVTAKSPWFSGILQEREKTGLAAHIQISPSLTTLDTSQSIERMPTGYNWMLPTIIPGGRTWMRLEGQEERMLCGMESLSLQGYPMDLLKALQRASPDISDNLLADMGGNAFSCPIVVGFLASVIIHLTPEMISCLTTGAPVVLPVLRTQGNL